eukprot:COSAG04_NODE_8938_length_915_cov_1.139706_1_plen_94_part_10
MPEENVAGLADELNAAVQLAVHGLHRLMVPMAVVLRLHPVHGVLPPQRVVLQLEGVPEPAVRAGSDREAPSARLHRVKVRRGAEVERMRINVKR